MKVTVKSKCDHVLITKGRRHVLLSKPEAEQLLHSLFRHFDLDVEDKA
jgi:hypothetical protein